MKVWVVTGRTESGDAVGPYAWKHLPTYNEIIKTLKRDWDEEFKAFGPTGGIEYSCVPVEVQE